MAGEHADIVLTVYGEAHIAFAGGKTVHGLHQLVYPAGETVADDLCADQTNQDAQQRDCNAGKQIGILHAVYGGKRHQAHRLPAAAHQNGGHICFLGRGKMLPVRRDGLADETGLFPGRHASGSQKIILLAVEHHAEGKGMIILLQIKQLIGSNVRSHAAHIFQGRCRVHIAQQIHFAFIRPDQFRVAVAFFAVLRQTQQLLAGLCSRRNLGKGGLAAEAFAVRKAHRNAVIHGAAAHHGAQGKLQIAAGLPVCTALSLQLLQPAHAVSHLGRKAAGKQRVLQVVQIFAEGNAGLFRQQMQAGIVASADHLGCVVRHHHGDDDYHQQHNGQVGQKKFALKGEILETLAHAAALLYDSV